MKNYSIISEKSAWRKMLCVLCVLCLSTVAAFSENKEEKNNSTSDAIDITTEVNEAMANPEWIKVTGKVAGFKKEDGKYYLIYKVTYKNNNKNGKIVTAIFDKKLKLTGTMTWTGYQSGKAYSEPFESTLRSSKVNKMELYPGQSYTVTFRFDVEDVKGWTRKVTDNTFKSKDLTFKRDKWWHTYQIETK